MCKAVTGLPGKREREGEREISMSAPEGIAHRPYSSACVAGQGWGRRGGVVPRGDENTHDSHTHETPTYIYTHVHARLLIMRTLTCLVTAEARF